MAVVDPNTYDASLTPAAIAAFRAKCRSAAATLRARGAKANDLVVTTEVVAVPRSFLGIKRAPTYRHEQKVTLRGWELHQVRTLMGQSGPEWYQWTVAIALGADGELYRVERRREERNGRPTSNDGKVIVAPFPDAEFPLFDMLEPERFRKVRPTGYWDPFPRKLSKAVDNLLR